MSDMPKIYLIGRGIDPASGDPYLVEVICDFPEIGDLTLCVLAGRFPGTAIPYSFPPCKMLEFSPQIFRDELVHGKVKSVHCGEETPGWFERKCEGAGCTWFMPYARRLAAGEKVRLDEIQAASKKHHGREMPRAGWHRDYGHT